MVWWYCSFAQLRILEVTTVLGMIHAQLTKTEKVAFPEKYHVLMNYSEGH